MTNNISHFRYSNHHTRGKIRSIIITYIYYDPSYKPEPDLTNDEDLAAHVVISHPFGYMFSTEVKEGWRPTRKWAIRAAKKHYLKGLKRCQRLRY